MAYLLVRCECGEQLLLKSEHAGRSGRCKECRKRITIPQAKVFASYANREVPLGELAMLGDGAPANTAPQQKRPEDAKTVCRSGTGT